MTEKERKELINELLGFDAAFADCVIFIDTPQVDEDEHSEHKERE